MISFKLSKALSLEPIISIFDENRPIKCLIVVSDQSMKVHEDIYIPIYQIDFEFIEKFDKEFKYCQHSVIALKDEKKLQSAINSKVILNIEKVAVVFEDFLNFTYSTKDNARSRNFK